jgi:hypothetical protein
LGIFYQAATVGRWAEPSIINEKTVADFTRVVEQIGILERGPGATEARQPDE